MRRTVFTTYDPNLPSGKKFVSVHVQNEDPLYFLVEVKSKACELFAQISKFLNLLEPELFGLAIRCSDSFVFLDPLEKLSKYAPKQWRTQNNGMDNDGLPLFNVYFRVQFYVDSYLFISDKVAKLLYYHQMRENVLHYEQSLSEERAFLLASYALQADYGNYNAQLHKEHYFEPNHYFPSWVIAELGVDYIVRHLPTLHCDHKGMPKSEAQAMYIKEASDAIAPHNFHLYQLTCKKPGANAPYEVSLAITISGIAVYAADCSATGNLAAASTATPANSTLLSAGVRLKSRLKSRISFFPWTDIGKLSFDKKKFEIRSTGPQGRKFIYYAASEDISRHLLWFSRASHQFHLMVQQKMKEMLKREAEISRRKYRESCISSSTSSANSVASGSVRNCSASSSSGASSASSSGGGVGGSVGIHAAVTPSASITVGITASSSASSKSSSPFEYSSASSTASSGVGSSAIGAANKAAGIKGHSDLDISHSHHLHHHHLLHHHLRHDQDRDEHKSVSVISNTSSNTTSGIVSDKAHGIGDDSDRDDIDSDLLMSLNHSHHHLNQHPHHLLHHPTHHHHRLTHHNSGVNHRAITLSGFSPQPVVSLESLAMSEPITENHHHHHHHHPHHSHHRISESDVDGKMNLAANKKHSISISNIVITAQCPPPAASSTAMTSVTTPTSTTTATSRNEDSFSNASSSSVSPVCANALLSTTPTSTTTTTTNSGATITTIDTAPSKSAEVLISGENCSKVLCLNINEPTSKNVQSSSPKKCCDYSSLSSFDRNACNDDVDCDDESLLHYATDDTDSVFDNTGKSFASSKSNVTVLSTILKPEAERLLKQGYEADDAELMIDDGIDSIELAELKEFEQAEKEKIILNSLINKLPPPPPMSSSSESSDSDDDSDSSSSLDNDDNYQNDRNDRTRNRNNRHCYSPLTQERMMHHRLYPTSPYNRRISSNSSSQSSKPKSTDNHIYENLKQDHTAMMLAAPTPSVTRNLPLEALVTPRKTTTTTIPPPLPLRPYPSLNETAFPAGGIHQYHGNLNSNHATPSYPQRTGMRIGVSSLNRPYANRARLFAAGPNCCGAGACHHRPTMQFATPSLLTPIGSNRLDISTLSVGSEPNLYFHSNQNASGPMARVLPANKSDSIFDCRLNDTSQGADQFMQSMLQPNITKTSPIVDPLPCMNSLRGGGGDESSSTASHQYNYLCPTSSSINDTHRSSNLKSATKEGSISDLHQLRQRSSDLNLPLITALFNDSSLMDQFDNQEKTSMSQSLQQIPQNMTTSNGYYCSHPSGATVERTSTFRVDEAIAKSTLRHSQRQNALSSAAIVNDNNNNRPDYSANSPAGVVDGAASNNRPISWHVDGSGASSCSAGHNRLFAHRLPMTPIAIGKPNPKSLYNANFVEQIWADRQLTT